MRVLLALAILAIVAMGFAAPPPALADCAVAHKAIAANIQGIMAVEQDPLAPQAIELAVRDTTDSTRPPGGDDITYTGAYEFIGTSPPDTGVITGMKYLSSTPRRQADGIYAIAGGTGKPIQDDKIMASAWNGAQNAFAGPLRQ